MKHYVFHVPGLPYNGKIATIIATPNNDFTYNFGLAIRSPQDNFNRKKGIAKANGRLSNTPYKNLTPNIGLLKIMSHITEVALRHNFHEVMDHSSYQSYFTYVQKFLENRQCNSPTQNKN